MVAVLHCCTATIPASETPIDEHMSDMHTQYMTKHGTSCSAMVEHWIWAGDYGLMTRSTANQYVQACRRLLSPLGDLDGLDVRNLDVEEVIKDFQESPPSDLSPQTQIQYEKLFRKAVPSFLDYVDDRHDWEPPSKRRGVATASPHPRRRPSKSAVSRASDSDVVVTIPIMLPAGRKAELSIPSVLSADEAKLLITVVTGYVNGHVGKAA